MQQISDSEVEIERAPQLSYRRAFIRILDSHIDVKRYGGGLEFNPPAANFNIYGVGTDLVASTITEKRTFNNEGTNLGRMFLFSGRSAADYGSATYPIKKLNYQHLFSPDLYKFEISGQVGDLIPNTVSDYKEMQKKCGFRDEDFSPRNFKIIFECNYGDFLNLFANAAQARKISERVENKDF